MIHLTLAIEDFLLMLGAALFWSGAGLVGWLLAGLALVGGVGGLAWWARRR